MLLLQLFSGNLPLLTFASIIIGILLGVTIHEYAHAFVAYKNGDYTAKYEGRLSLNPLAHLDPTGTIMLLLVGFGWGKPVPINPDNFKNKNSELKVAFAGIIANILLAFLLAIPIRIASMNGQLIESSPFLVFLNGVIEINLVLAAFNLIPIPPLDGSHLVEYFLNEEQKATYQTAGPSVLIGLILLSFLTNFSFFQIVVEPVVRFLSAIIEGTSWLSLLR
jgi:Zn-dependent protease